MVLYSVFELFYFNFLFFEKKNTFRRLLRDDSRGVAEALNERVCVLDTCQGLTVSGAT